MRGLVLYWPGGKPASIRPHKLTQPPIQDNFTLSLRRLMTLCVAILENSSPIPQAFNSSQQAFRCYAKPLSLLNNSQQGKVPCLPPLLLGIVLPLVLVMAEYFTFLWTATTLEGTLGNHSQQGHRMASRPGRCIALPGFLLSPLLGSQHFHENWAPWSQHGALHTKEVKETGSPRWEHHSKYHLPTGWGT